MSRPLTKKLAIIKPGMLLVGIDLGKQKNVAVVINQQARQLGRFSFGDDQAGYAFLGQQLQRICEQVGTEEMLVGMEPTGYFWKLVAAELKRRGLKYRLVNAYTVKKHREGDQLDRAKDDNRDAFAIADLLRTGKFTETQQLTGVYAELREYHVTYNRLTGEIGRLKGLLDTAVGHCFPELRQLFKSLTGQTVQAMLRQHAAAQAISRLSEAEFLAQVAADFTGQRLQKKKLRQAYQLASDSVGLADTVACQLTIRCVLDELALKEAQLLPPSLGCDNAVLWALPVPVSGSCECGRSGNRHDSTPPDFAASPSSGPMTRSCEPKRKPGGEKSSSCARCKMYPRCRRNREISVSPGLLFWSHTEHG